MKCERCIQHTLQELQNWESAASGSQRIEQKPVDGPQNERSDNTASTLDNAGSPELEKDLQIVLIMLRSKEAMNIMKNVTS